MHHHPILHTGPYLDSSDVIPNGDALIDLLNKAGECGRVLVLEAGGPHRQMRDVLGYDCSRSGAAADVELCAHDRQPAVAHLKIGQTGSLLNRR